MRADSCCSERSSETSQQWTQTLSNPEDLEYRTVPNNEGLWSSNPCCRADMNSMVVVNGEY